MNLRKTFICTILGICVCFTSFHVNTIKAEALATTSAAGVFESMMFLLALNGLKPADVETLEGNLQLTALETDLKEYSLDLYYWFVETSSKIAAGSNIVGLDQEKMTQFREWCQSKGWNAIDTRYKVGTSSTRFKTYTSTNISFSGTYLDRDININISGIDFGSEYYIFTASKLNDRGLACAYRLWLVPVAPYYETNSTVDISGIQITTGVNVTPYVNVSNYTFANGSCVMITIGQGTRYDDSTVTLAMLGSPFVTFNASTTSDPFPSYVIVPYLNKFYASGVADSDLDVEVMEGDGNVATATDQAVVGSGTLAREDENTGDIVMEGQALANLAGIDIEDLLKKLAQGQIDYQTLLESVGLALVNTQEQTLAEVQAIAQAQTITQAGTGTLTGGYTVSLSDLFPFCIPFDLYDIINCFKADPVAPSATISIPVGYNGSSFTWEDYEISLEAFDTVAAVVRVLEYVIFIIGLMLITRRLIEG